MDISYAVEYLKTLADGIDPVTGEKLPDEHICNRGETVRALYEVLKIAERRSKNLPKNTGTSWTAEEEEHLVDGFRSGMTETELAKEHGRTRGGISARLEKLGLKK